MEKIKFQSKKDPKKFIHKFKMSEDEFHSIDHESGGFCIRCGYETGGVEPDARKYDCDDCGENMVYGLQELLLMGYVEIESL